MIKEYLTVFADNNGVFSDHSLNSSNFIKDKFTVTLDETTDHLYIGFYKNFSNFYVEISQGTTLAGNFEVEYFDGSTWQSLSVEDFTQDFTRSGFFKFDGTLLNSTTINNLSNYYIRIKFTDTVEIVGIGCLFSDDCALQEDEYEIVNDCYYSSGFNSHIMSHVSARNYIMQHLRNGGYVKYIDECTPADITCFDILNMGELREASKYLTLSKIYLSLADNQDSIEWAKYEKYQNMFESTFSALKLTLDRNNNGLDDDEDVEISSSKSFAWSR